MAKDLIALDDISGGRLIAGVGSGGTGWDAEMFGDDAPPPAQRTARFEEFVELLDLLLREQEATFSGHAIPLRRFNFGTQECLPGRPDPTVVDLDELAAFCPRE